MEKLKGDLENTEQECEIINRREKLLNFRQTKFTAVANLKTEMAPFVTLWYIASSFTNVYEAWLYGAFNELESDKMDDFLSDCIKQLTRISKTSLATYAQPLTLVNYLNRELERFREYMPMVQAMRAKGLEKRHWI
jgi:dynein heavy chain